MGGDPNQKTGGGFFTSFIINREISNDTHHGNVAARRWFLNLKLTLQVRSVRFWRPAYHS